MAIERTEDDGNLLVMKATFDPVKDDEVVVNAEVAVATATRIEITFMAGDVVVSGDGRGDGREG